jgi:tRNA(adenine34) deaminase
MINFDNKYMQSALENALYAQVSGEIPVGAVIIQRNSGQIISSGYNLVETENNPLKHAEMIAIDSACKELKSKNLSECDLYVTLEPCAMCSAAISYARIGRLFYGASDPKQGAVEHGPRFFTQSTCMHRPEIYDKIMANESSTLLKAFFEHLRNN